MALDLEANKPKDVIVVKDATLLDDVFALEKRQEAAVLKAGAVLAEEFGAQVNCEQYKIEKNGSLIVIYKVYPRPTVFPNPDTLNIDKL